MSKNLEVCIVSYDSADALVDALAHLERSVPDADVAIREHGRDAEALARLTATITSSDLSIRLHLDPSNPGFGAGCNALATESTAEWLVFLNPDANVVRWPWSDGRRPPVGTIVGATLLGNGRPSAHYGRSYGVLDEIGRSWLRRTGRRPAGDGFVSGAALLVDRESFERVGGFDEAYFMFYEDLDLCRRANAVGIPTIVEDDWIVEHAGAHSTSRLFAESLVWSYESATRYHAGERLAPIHRTYVGVDAAARALVHRVRGDRQKADAYAGLVRRVFVDLVRHSRRPRAAPDQLTK